MKRSDIEVRLTALGAAVSLSALVLGGVVAAFGGAGPARTLPDTLPPVARDVAPGAPIPVAIVPGRIEVTGERRTDTAENEPSRPTPSS